MLSETDELQLFDTKPVIELIEYGWNTFAYKFHMFGCMMHLFYMLTLSIFVNEIYCKSHTGHEEDTIIYNFLLALGILYPFFYDNIQLYKTGFIEYFSQIWNFTDLLFIWSGFANIVIQFYLKPTDLLSKIVIIVVILMAIIKTFFYIRIFESLSYIVILLKDVM